MNVRLRSLSILVFLGAAMTTVTSIAVAVVAAPDISLTPGALCSADSPDFKGYAYGEKVALCTRNVGPAEKKEVAANYNIGSQDEWPNYEFDHLIPLCAGGGNDESNIWPQPIDEAKEKDKVENSVCRAMKDGTMTQAEAVQKIKDWFEQNRRLAQGLEPKH